MELCCSNAKHLDCVKWNPYNQVIQCHSCGHVYLPARHLPDGKPWNEDLIKGGQNNE